MEVGADFLREQGAWKLELGAAKHPWCASGRQVV
jgi:hypothetical protein